MVAVTTLRNTSLGRYLEGLLTGLNDLRPLMEDIGFNMKENTRLRLSEGVDIYGEEFVTSFRASDEGGQTLIDTGLLRNSIDYLATKKSIEWGVTKAIPYAWILNAGGIIKPKKKKFLRFKLGGQWQFRKFVVMPERRFIGLSNEDQQMLLDLVYSFLSQSGA